MIIEWWSVERKGQPCQNWRKTILRSKRRADKLTASILLADSTILCIHRTSRKPESARPEPLFKPQ